ncbi:MAG: sigma-54 dependent transcriptional regulator [Proteobacteria bacterium]|nr:sigma-54 dependent transcriptional regulator [Pseudomonadota bacterium]
MQKALLVDDDRNIVQTLEIYLEEKGFAVTTAGSAQKGVACFKEQKPDLVLLDLRLPDQDGLEVLHQIIASGIPTHVIVITAYATVETAVKAVKMGAFDYLPKPFLPSQLDLLLDKISQFQALRNEVARLKGIFQEGDLLTRSRRMHQVLDTARQAAKSNAIVLISGESGTGKGVLASLVHKWSQRASQPFVTVDCAGLHENLLESDLFGHVKGAFTGATRDKTGKLSLAEKGTIFLDEVSEIPYVIQGKLLRFIQQRQYECLGGTQTLTVDARVIAATNRDLDELVRDGIFRQDLYFRLNVVELFLPPLRERPEDIPLLVEHYLRRFAQLNDKPVKEIEDECLQCLQSYPWPGNIRELVNVIERAVILSEHPRLRTSDLPAHIAHYQQALPDRSCLISLAEMEKKHIQEVMIHSPSLEEAARALGINLTTLWRKRKQYSLD